MSDSLTRAFRGLPGTFWALFAGTFVMALATFVFPFLALFLRSRGYSVEETGLMVALYGFGSIPAGPLAGWLADRVGRRPTLLGALVCAAVLTALLPFLKTPVLLSAGALLLGLSASSYFPASSAVVSDIVPPARYGDVFGLMYWERNVGIAVSFALGGALAAYGYERLFWADAATTLLFVAVVYFKVPETLPAAAARATGKPGWSAVFADGPFCLLMAIQTVFAIGLLQFMVAVPVVMASKGLTPGHYGLAMSVNGVLIALLSPFVSRVTEKREPGHVLALASLFVAGGYGAYAFCATPLEYCVATGVWSLGEILSLPTISALVASLSPEDLRGRYQGLFSLSFGVAMALAPAVGGAVVERAGAQALWAGVVVTCVLVAVAHVLAARGRRRHAAAASPD
ncbi:MAG: MFS transporter [Myxococcales bacterium]